MRVGLSITSPHNLAVFKLFVYFKLGCSGLFIAIPNAGSSLIDRLFVIVIDYFKNTEKHSFCKLILFYINLQLQFNAAMAKLVDALP